MELGRHIINETHVYLAIPFCFSIVLEKICLLNIFEVSICPSTELCGLVEKSLSLEKSLAAQVP